MTIRIPDPKANTTTEAYLAYKAGVLEESELKPVLYEPYLHFDGWLAYWTGLTDTYPNKGPGKNLFVITNQDFTVGNINFKVSKGSLYLNGTSAGEINTNNINYKNNFSFILPAGNYIISLSESITAMSLRKLSDDTILATINGNTLKSATFSLNEETEVYLGFYLYQVTFSNKLAPIQIEKGSSATEYEPYSPIPEMLTDEEACVAYLAGVTDTYPKEIKDPYDVRLVGYLKHLIGARWEMPELQLNNSELYLSMLKPSVVPSGDPSSNIDIKNTAEAPFESLEVYGDTTQQTYTGKNLFDKVAATTGNSYYSLNPDGTITTTATNAGGRQYMTLSLGAGTYTISYILYFSNMTNNNVRITARNMDDATFLYEGWNYDATSGTKYSFSFTVSSTANIGICICPQFAIPSGGAFYFDETQIELGPTATSYEPYVGGVASPNPDYPQTVNVVTGTQSVLVCGKNLFDKSATATGKRIGTNGEEIDDTPYFTSDYIPVNPSNTYKFSGYTQLGGSSALAQYDSNKNFIKRVLGYGWFNVSLEQNTAYIKFCTLLTEIDTIQLELGSTVTDYEPYTGATYTVNLGSTELCKIGTYQDYIYKSGDDWYVHKETKKIVLDGTETIESWSSGTITNGYKISSISNLISINNTSTANVVMSDFFTKVINQSYLTSNDIEGFATTNSNLYFRLNKNLGAFGTWLTTHNTSVYYALATPTDNKITEPTLISQLDAIVEGGSYQGETIITVTANGDNLPALLKVEALRYE